MNPPALRHCPRPNTVRLPHPLRLLQVDATAALRTLDMGPPADRAKEAAAFRAFWGDKAELRRFQVGGRSVLPPPRYLPPEGEAPPPLPLLLYLPGRCCCSVLLPLLKA